MNKKQRQLLLDHIVRLVPSLVKTQFPQITVLLNLFQQYMREKFPHVIRESHVKALTQNPLPEARVNFLREVKWFLLIREPGSFILGDVAVASVIGAHCRLKSLPDLTDDVLQIALPISDTHLIAGTKNQPFTDDVEQINMATASLSYDFFISSRNSERQQTYASALGTHANLLTEEELQEIVRNGFAELAAKVVAI